MLQPQHPWALHWLTSGALATTRPLPPPRSRPILHTGSIPLQAAPRQQQRISYVSPRARSKQTHRMRGVHTRGHTERIPFSPPEPASSPHPTPSVSAAGLGVKSQTKTQELECKLLKGCCDGMRRVLCIEYFGFFFYSPSLLLLTLYFFFIFIPSFLLLWSRLCWQQPSPTRPFLQHINCAICSSYSKRGHDESRAMETIIKRGEGWVWNVG